MFKIKHLKWFSMFFLNITDSRQISHILVDTRIVEQLPVSQKQIIQKSISKT
jgi:hypothetical protein